MTEVSNGGRILDELVFGFLNIISNSFVGSFSVLSLPTDLRIVLGRPRMGEHSESQIFVGCSWISDHAPRHICLCAFRAQTKGLRDVRSKYPCPFHVFERRLDGLFFDGKVFVVFGRRR